MEERYYLMKNLRRIRGFLQLSQVEFSKEVGISKSTLQEIEKGNGATLDTLMCIADYMNISVADLLTNPDKIENTLLAVEFLEKGALHAPACGKPEELFARNAGNPGRAGDCLAACGERAGG